MTLLNPCDLSSHSFRLWLISFFMLILSELFLWLRYRFELFVFSITFVGLVISVLQFFEVVARLRLCCDRVCLSSLHLSSIPVFSRNNACMIWCRIVVPREYWLLRSRLCISHDLGENCISYVFCLCVIILTCFFALNMRIARNSWLNWKWLMLLMLF